MRDVEGIETFWTGAKVYLKRRHDEIAALAS